MSPAVYFADGNGDVDVDGLVTQPGGDRLYVLQHTGTLEPYLNAFSGGGYWTALTAPAEVVSRRRCCRAPA